MVAGGDEIMPQINAMMDDFDIVALTQDWHPTGHSSFASSHDDAMPFTLTEMPYGPQVPGRTTASRQAGQHSIQR